MVAGPPFLVTRAIFILAVLLLATPLRANDPSAKATPAASWQEIAQQDGVTIFSRTRPGSVIPEFRSVGEIDSPSRAIFAVLNDAQAFPDFMPYTAECRILQQAKTARVTYQRLDLPLVADRDYTVRSDFRVTPGAKGPLYFIHWHLANELGPPPRPGVHRLQTCEGSWLLEPVTAGKTRATYTIYSGTGGAVPAFLADHGSRIGIGKLFDAVRKRALDPRYKAEGRIY